MTPAPAPPPEPVLVAMPFHTALDAEYDIPWQPYAEYLECFSGRFCEVGVCLHPVDFADDASRGAFERLGFRVFTNGSYDDPEFLDRLHRNLGSASAVTSNRVGTGLVYAAAMGREVWAGGPTRSVLRHARGFEFADEDERVERFQAERYPEFIAGMDAAAAREYGRHTLGAGSLLGPDRASPGARLAGLQAGARPLARPSRPQPARSAPASRQVASLRRRRSQPRRRIRRRAGRSSHRRRRVAAGRR